MNRNSRAWGVERKSPVPPPPKLSGSGEGEVNHAPLGSRQWQPSHQCRFCAVAATVVRPSPSLRLTPSGSWYDSEISRTRMWSRLSMALNSVQ